MEPTFSERLSSWLRFTGIRPASLARALNVSRTAVHNWVNGVVEPSTDRLAPIAQVLGVSVAEFFARMPAEDAALNAAREEAQRYDEELDSHPLTGENTRELSAPALQASLDQSEACPTCCRHGEAA